MRYTLLIIFSIISFQLLAQEYRSVQTEFIDLEIKLPKTWDLEIKGKTIQTYAPIPDNIGISYIEPTSKSLDQKYNMYVEPLKNMPGFTTIEEGKENINGLEYKWIEYEMVDRGVTFHSYLYTTVHEGALYSITVTSTKSRYKKYRGKLLKIVRSIKIK